MKKMFKLYVLSSLVLITQSALAYLPNVKLPVCLDRGQSIQMNNEQIKQFKTSKPNQYLARAFVTGTVISEPFLQGSHMRFFMSMGQATDKVSQLEIIYNIEFGSIPSIHVGESVTVCGDFINSFAKTAKYPPSPAGAIVHWVHYNPATRQGSMDHPHGFIMSDKDLIGFDDAPNKAWNGYIVRGYSRSKRIKAGEEVPPPPSALF